MANASAAAAAAAAGAAAPSIWEILDMCPGAAQGSAAIDPSPFVAFNDWVNGLVLPASFAPALVPLIGRLGLTYLRNLLLGSALYWLVCGAWHYVIYHGPSRETNFPGGKGIPTRATLINQMTLAQSSMLLYAGLPTFSEELIERGLTRVYYCPAEVGGGWAYLSWTALYLALVEIGIYWMHRTLHTNKFLFKHIHALHHQVKFLAYLYREYRDSPSCTPGRSLGWLLLLLLLLL
eukprot:COSAG05_NODE_1301_length_5243_cov_2.688375_4_plen_234_part_01